MSRGKSQHPLNIPTREHRGLSSNKVNIVRDPKTISFAPKTLVLLIACPGAGKSSFAKSLFGNLDNYEIISTDELRAKAPNSAGEWDQSVSWWAFKVAHSKTGSALKDGKTVIFDATNTNPRSRKELREIAKEANARVEVIHFNTSLETCLKRNELRGLTQPMRCVEKPVVEKFYQAVLDAGQAIVQEPYARVIFLSERGQEKLMANNPIKAPALPIITDKKLTAKLLAKDPVNELRQMVQSGEIKEILPEFEICVGFDQKSKYHDLTLDEHVYAVMDKMAELTDKPALRLAAALHDLGKPESAWPVAVLEGREEGNLHFYANKDEGKEDHAVIGARIAEQVMLREGFDIKTIQQGVKIVRHHMFPEFKTVQGATKFLRRIGNDLELAEDLMIMREADHAGKPNAKSSVSQMRELIKQAQEKPVVQSRAKLVIRGDEIAKSLRIKPGPQLGELVNYLQTEIREKRLANNKQAILKQAKLWLKK